MGRPYTTKFIVFKPKNEHLTTKNHEDLLFAHVSYLISKIFSVYIEERIYRPLANKRTIGIGIILIFLLFSTGCRLAYIFHVAAGQFQLLNDSVPIQEALESNSLDAEHKARLRLVASIKSFGENELGLKQSRNYQTVHLKSSRHPIYIVSACPKDRLVRKKWWFPIVGNVPYLGFFDLKSAKAEKKALIKKDLDVTMGVADAYSTLGWFRDPVTLNLIQGPTVDLVETILHEMTHLTLYIKGQGEFNEGLAVLVGKMGAFLFLEETYGSTHPLTIEAKNSIDDERIFSSFLASLLEDLERLYNSPASYSEKLAKREKVFARSLEDFRSLKKQLKTSRFSSFGDAELNNAYLMSIGLYHQHFSLFEEALKKNGNSVKTMMVFFYNLAKDGGDLLKKTQARLCGSLSTVTSNG
jgi:predicted aminopeptidase